ncbi:MAG: FkbM family methyltransferase [Lachnospiraceae bacterium]|nr:FkbM family methyltransferase [Lachnospiraceae bacterium]
MCQIIKDIYGHLGDGASREIYADRLLFSLTGDRKYMTNIIKKTALYQRLHEILVNDRYRKYIASAGQWGQIIADLFQEFGFSGMIDNYVTGSYKKLPIMTVTEYAKNVPNGTAYIASTSFHAEFYQMLKDAGVEEERIVNVTRMMLDVYHQQQYFDLPFLQDQKMKHEIFVDGGCYDGENSRMFAKWAGDAEKTIYAFEPDQNNFRNCQHVLDEIDDVSYELIPKGLWSSEKVLEFCANANEGSRFCAGGETCIPVTNLDTVIDGKVTFIKMDIEGAEYEALRGAENLIQKCKPKLAISIYHKAEDIWELPKLILSFCPEYTFYLRHYSLSSEETVLYAV